MVVLKFRRKKWLLHAVLAAKSGVDGSPYCRGSTLSICKNRVTLSVLIYFLRKTYIKASGAPHKHHTSPINNPSHDGRPAEAVVRSFEAHVNCVDSTRRLARWEA
jgi:hypothetical protein